MLKESELKTRGYVIVKSTVGSGLGDRIRAVISAILYARESNRRLHVMWDDGLYGPEGENVFSLLFDLHGFCSENFDPNRLKTTRPSIWEGCLHIPMKRLYAKHGPEEWDRRKVIEMFSFDHSSVEYDEDALVMWEFDQLGRCFPEKKRAWLGAKWSNFEYVSNVAREHLAPSQAVRKRVAFFREEKFLPSMIGVHVRRTTEPKAAAKQVGAASYHRQIRRIRRLDPNTGIFLATDNRDVEAEFRARYGDAVVCTEKFLGKPGTPLHLTSADRPRLENALEALTDMFLLASCQYLLYPAQSSFSLAARYFSSADESDIYAFNPKRGFRQVARSVSSRTARQWSTLFS